MNIPFPSGGGDWRFDVKSGRMVDASKAQAEPEPVPAAPEPTEPKPARKAGKRTAK